MSQIPPPLPADERRRAFATTGGFVFQWWLTVHAWLDLKENEALYVESSEDFEIVSGAAGTTVQAKAGTSSAVTLRSDEVIAALNHFWSIASSDCREVQFVFLAQATAGVEQGAPFGAGVAGLALWMNGDASAREQLRRFLREDAAVAAKLNPGLRDFIRDATAEDFLHGFVKRLIFDLGREPSGVVRDLVRDRLVVMAVDGYGATVTEAERLMDVLFTQVVHLAASKERVPLNRAHLLRLIEVQIVQLREHLGLTLPAFTAAGAGNAALWDAPANELALPPLPDRILRRPAIVAGLVADMAKTRALVLIGTTGMGKTTLAKLMAQADGQPWWWLDLQGCPAAEVPTALRKILSIANHHPGAPLNVVLDGFAAESLPAAALHLLRSIAWLARRRDGKVILTTQKPLTGTELAGLGWTHSVTHPAPRMSIEEIEELLRELGCTDEPLAKVWAAALALHSEGHPQLAHAGALWLQQQGWPKFDGQAFTDSATSVDTERAQARSLVARLSGEELELLTRLTVLGDRFRRDHALSMAEKLERLPGAGFRFDALVGPWIEPANALGYHRLSPLLENTAATVAADRRRDLQVASARVRLENTPVYFQDAAIALRHAFDASAGQLATEIASKFLVTRSDHRARAFRYLLWLMVIPDEAIDQVEPSHDGVAVALHLLRFQIAVTLLPAHVPKYLALCEQKLKRRPPELAASQRFVLLNDALMHCAGSLVAADVVRYIEEATFLFRSLPGDFNPAQWFPRAMLPPSLRTVPDEDRIRISLAGLVLGQIGGEVFLAELVAVLGELPPDRREKMAAAFAAWPTLLCLAVDKIWLEEDKKPTPDWERLIDWYSEVAARATAANLEPFAVLLTRAASIVCNEYLNDPERAARLLAGATAPALPAYGALWLDQEAKIAAHIGKLPDALAVVRQALRQWEESDFDLHPKMLALQRAGTWAGRLELWDESAEHFSGGAKLARRLRLVVNEAGLETDAAVARWQAFDRANAITGFARALDLCQKMPPAADDLATYQFQKLLGHVLLTFALGRRRVAAGVVQPPIIAGIASEPALNDKVKSLPPPQLATYKVLIAMLDHDHQLGDERWSAWSAELLASRALSVRSFAVELAMRKAILRHAANELPGLSSQLAAGFAVVRAMQVTGDPMDAALRTQDMDFPPAAAPFDDQMCGLPVYQAALISAVAQGTEMGAFLRDLALHVPESPFPAELKMWIDHGLAIVETSGDELLEIAERATVQEGRFFAAVALLNRAQLAPEVLWTALYVTLSALRSMYWGADVLRELDRFAGGRWRRAAEDRLAFRDPTLWLPDLKAHCGQRVDGAQRIAGLLLIAIPAIRRKVPAVIAEELRAIRDGGEGTLSAPWDHVAPKPSSVREITTTQTGVGFPGTRPR